MLEIDHVELQTCSCGCPQCIRGEEDPPAQERGPAAGCACARCFPVAGGLGCWRSVYQGPDCRCQIKLQRGNALHHFRLLVRARRPPPERRGFRRPKQQDTPNAGLKHHGTAPYVGDSAGTFADNSPQRLGGRRGRRKRHSGVNLDGYDTDGSDPPLALVCYDDVLPRDICMGGSAKCCMPGTTSALDDVYSPNSPVSWFSSASVFVDSRPPAIALHGIGTALVLTWPPLARFSGSENVSYILEQWSSVPVVAASSTAIVSPAMPTTGRGNCRLQNRPQEHSSRHRRRHHHHRFCRPRPDDAKEVFSVGRRCWFVPSPLQGGTRYWYRLRLVHEGGRSVAGPWASHVASIDPPRCIEVGRHSLVLYLPRTIDDRVDRVGGGHKGIDGSRAPTRSTSRRHERETPLRQPFTTIDKTEHHAGKYNGEDDGECGGDERKMGATSGATSQRYDLSTKGTGGVLGSEGEVPVVWYTLEGLEIGSRWIEQYRGSSPEIIVEVR